MDNLQPLNTAYFVVLADDGTGRSKSLRMFQPPPPVDRVPAGAIELTKNQYDDWVANPFTRAWRNGEVVSVDSNQVIEVPSIVVVSRLTDAGLLRAALVALKVGVPLTDPNLSDDDLALRTLWEKSSTLRNDDKRVLALLRAIGADPKVILAPATTSS